jgi:hypothetical protein
MPRVPMMAIIVLILGSMLRAQNTASDQETISQLVQQVKDLQKQTLELQQRVQALEVEKASLAGPTAGTSSPLPDQTQAAQASQPAQAMQPAPEATTTSSVHDLKGIQWRGFGEVDYKVLNQRQPELGTYGFVPGSAGDFYTGDFDLFLHSRIGDRTSVLGDIAFEEIDAQSYKLDMRQALLQYEMNDHLKMSFGRYQTGVGYYNQAFRSAEWLQTTADRPLIMEYASNGGILPTQAVGVSIGGSIPSGSLDLHYTAEYGSADTIRPDLNGDGEITDENNGNHVLVGLFARPSRLPGLQVGGSVFQDKISDDNAGAGSVRYGQTIVNGYVVYMAHGLEFLNEGFLIRHVELHGLTQFNMPAFYSQVSQRFGHLRPFVRYQYVNANPESAFDDVLLRYGPSFGARYDFNDYVAFKAQLDHTARKGQPDLNGLQLQFAFAF